MKARKSKTDMKGKVGRTDGAKSVKPRLLPSTTGVADGVATGLYRMRQFYEYYKDDEFVSPLVRQIDWTHHLIVMARAKSPEERRFYLVSSCASKQDAPAEQTPPDYRLGIGSERFQRVAFVR